MISIVFAIYVPSLKTLFEISSKFVRDRSLVDILN